VSTVTAFPAAECSRTRRGQVCVRRAAECPRRGDQGRCRAGSPSASVYHADRVACVARPVGLQTTRTSGAYRAASDADHAGRGRPGQHRRGAAGESGRRRSAVPEHAAAAQGVQHLFRDPMISSACPRPREDDDSDRARWATAARLLGLGPAARLRVCGVCREGITRDSQPECQHCLRVTGATPNVFTALICRITRPAAMIGALVP